MTVKLLGAFLVVIGCGGFGFRLAASQKREEQLLHKLSNMITYFISELQYRRTKLPELCRQAAFETSGLLSRLFTLFASELEQQISPDPGICMQTALSGTSDIPESVLCILLNLGNCLGRFDLEGQLQDLDIVRRQCEDKALALHQNRDIRLRTYQTLGLCAGAALVIIFI